ncbi:hypothetical protein C8Q74DRAFT_1252917 [Fomes fomentarius]|nr:hypothetical protein C8Q74DRAFT_1252917 [Fomes fomentarius]
MRMIPYKSGFSVIFSWGSKRHVQQLVVHPLRGAGSSPHVCLEALERRASAGFVAFLILLSGG